MRVITQLVGIVLFCAGCKPEVNGPQQKPNSVPIATTVNPQTVIATLSPTSNQENTPIFVQTVTPHLTPEPNSYKQDSIKLLFYDDEQNSIQGISVHIRSVTSGLFFESRGASNEYGLLYFSVPAASTGIEYEVQASKAGYLSRTGRVKIFWPGEAGSHWNTIIFGAKTGTSVPALPLSPKPELQRIELQAKSNQVNGFKLFFSEPMNNQSVEEHMVIRKPLAQEQPNVRPPTLENTNGEIIFAPKDFTWSWNSQQTEAIAQLLPEKSYPPEPPIPRFEAPKWNKYQLSFTAQTQTPELKDSTGDVRKSPFILPHLTRPNEYPSYFTNAFVFEAQQNQ